MWQFGGDLHQKFLVYFSLFEPDEDVLKKILTRAWQMLTTFGKI